MTVTEQPIPVKNPITESVRNIVGAINLAITLITIGCMVSASIYLIFFENPPKAIGFVAIAVGVKYLFTIKRIV